jgi:hypothetical protein
VTNEESSTLMMNVIFRGRIKVEALRYADSMYSEPSSTAAHNTRIRWANDTFRNPDMAAQNLQPVVVMDPAVQSAGVDPVDGDSTIADVALGGAVQAAVNKML